MKHDFEIAVDYKLTRACDQILEVVPDYGCPPMPTGQPRPYLVNIWFNFQGNNNQGNKNREFEFTFLYIIYS